MKAVQREASVRRRTIRPIQIARFIQSADRTVIQQAQPFAIPITTPGTADGWDEYGSALLSSSPFWSSLGGGGVFAHFNADTIDVDGDFVMPLLSSAAAQFRSAGVISFNAYSPGPTDFARVSALQVVLLDDVPPGSPTWSATWDIDVADLAAATGVPLQIDLSAPDSTSGTVVLSEAAGLQFIWTIDGGAAQSVGVFGVLDVALYNDPGVPQAAAPTRVHYWSDRPLTYRYRDSVPIPFDPRIRDVGDLSPRMTHIPRPNQGDSLRQSLALTLLNHPDVPRDVPYADFLEEWPLLFGELEIAQLNLEPGMTLDDVANLPPDSHDVWFRGVARGIDESDEAELRLVGDTNLDPGGQQWLGQVLTDAAAADPVDLGKRYDVPLGVATDIPLLGVDVPAYTTIAAATDDNQTTIELADATQFPASPSGTYKALIGDEVISFTGKSGNTLTGVTRGIDASVTRSQAVAHGIGETVIELGNDSTVWTWGGLEFGDLVTDVRIRNGIASDILVAGSTRWNKALGDRVSITGAQLRAELQDLVTQGRALTQQPEADTGPGPDVTLTEKGSARISGITIDTGSSGSPTPTEMYDEDTGTYFEIGADDSIPDEAQLTFTNTPAQGSPISQVLRVYWDLTGVGPFFNPHLRIYEGAGVTGPLIGSLTGQGDAAGWYEFSVSDPTENVFTFNNGANSNVAHVAEVERRITYEDPGFNDTITTEAAAAVSVGKGLRVHATVMMHQKSIADSTADLYPLTTEADPVELFPDVLRFLLQNKLGIDTRLVSEGGQLEDASWAIADSELGSNLVDGLLSNLGDGPEEAIHRFCWEHGAQLTRSEAVDKTVWRLHVAQRIGSVPNFASGSSGDVRYVWPSPARTITHWKELKRSTRDARSIFNGSYAFLYDHHLPREVDQVEGFAGLLASSRFDSGFGVGLASQRRVGIRNGDGLYAFLTIGDLDTAARTAGYYHNEGARDYAKPFEVRGIPWVEAYDVEVGDIVLLSNPNGPLRIGAGRVFDPLDRLELDPLGVHGYVARLAGNASGGAYAVSWDLSFVDSLSLQVQIAPTLWEADFSMRLTSASGGSLWDFTQAGANAWETHTFDLSSPDSTTGSGATLSEVTDIGFVHADVGSGTDDLLFAKARYALADLVKCRVVGRDKTWGIRGDVVNLSLVEVT